MTPQQAVAQIIQENPAFALGEVDIRGVRQRIFPNAPDCLTEIFKQSADSYDKDDAVLVYQDERWTYSALSHDIQQIAAALTEELGVKQGDRVALVLRNYPEMVILVHAVVAIGAVVVPMNAWWSSNELHYGLSDCGAKVVFTDERCRQRIQPFASELGLRLIGVRDANTQEHYDKLYASVESHGWPSIRIAPEDDYAVFYSSGSTGKPKGVVLTHRSVVSTLYSFLMALQIPVLTGDAPEPDPDVQLCSLVVTPLFHVTAMHASLFGGTALGARIVLMYKWDAEEAVRIVERERVTNMTGVPTQSMDLFHAATRMGAGLASLQALGAGGAKRPAAQVAQLNEAFENATIASGWGLTETSALGTTVRGAEYIAHPDAAGRAIPPLQELRIVNDEDEALPVNEIGEVVVKGPNIMRCYLNLPEETEKSLRDGWFYTGDLGYLDETGMLYIVDRKKDVILRGGENVACLEVEDAIYQHPAVWEACVFALPHERLGETVGACIQVDPENGIDQTALQAFLGERLAAFKVPEQIWIQQDPLSRGDTDKIDRRGLREKYANEAVSG